MPGMTAAHAGRSKLVRKGIAKTPIATAIHQTVIVGFQSP
jgi:hypothetical protein